MRCKFFIVPPFSVAFCRIMFYHLTPNSVVFLSPFLHSCEGFLGILLDLELCHHLFCALAR
uniref:Transposase (putative) gypsy type domain-containing protein n=1 Tax=Aegilops tauschii subsp. strangulata TaxID=200361 RepID=A0A453NHQ1_AEGTS